MFKKLPGSQLFRPKFYIFIVHMNHIFNSRATAQFKYPGFIVKPAPTKTFN
jgi:hypothetical protein